ncbi:EAL domain-containing protein [Solibacillus silvestris]|uniref:putative bifunctional diguanylate cyclase/phosphodiesterase n=1 Tax=Solibacillus silvestris TaxID=76853 RepID=UPI003F817EDC
MSLDQSIPLSKDRLFIWLKTLSNQLSKGSLIIDANDENIPILHANHHFLKLTAFEDDQVINQNINILNGHRTNEKSIKELNSHLKSGIAKKFTILHYTKEGSAFWNSITLHPLRCEDNIIQYILLTCEDTTEAELNKMIYKLEHEVYEAIDNEDNLQSILNLISWKIELYYIRDVYCTIHLFDQHHEIKSLGSHTLPVHVVNELDLFTIAPNSCFNPIAVYLKDFGTAQQHAQLFKYCNLNFIRGSWTKPILTPQNEVIGILTLFNQDDADLKQIDINYLNRLALLIQLAVKYAEQKIELSRLAFYDVETNLPNLHYFKSELAEWIEAGESGFVAIIHPAEFNKVVDLYGRQAGAELLRQMADRMREYLPAGDELISRFSNSIILGKKAEADRFKYHHKHVEPLTLVPFIIDGKENYITLKIGYTTFDKALTVEQCIHQTDIALSKARNLSGTSFAMYEENSTKQLTEEMEIFNQLAYALHHEEFEVYLQPKINFTTIEVEGFEALSRWNSSKLGFISPVKYIPIAEQSGKIKDIDLLNFKKVLVWLQNRIDEGKKILPVALNISPDHFYDPNFLKNILDTFNKFNVPAKYIKLEVTESIELVDFAKAKEILARLKELGIECSIDDFGVGFSSLSYLPQLPFSEIKIDRSFVSSMNEPGMYAIVQTIIQLAKNIKMRPIAEGIETEEQLIMLQQLGCPAGQGYYFYKPMAIADAEQLLDT